MNKQKHNTPIKKKEKNQKKKKRKYIETTAT